MSTIEIVATAFGVASVLLTVRRHIACWPTGLVQVTLFIWVFWQARLYSDMVLHVIYVGLQLYGWHRWLRGGEGGATLQVTRGSGKAQLFWVSTTVLGSILWGWGMQTWTDASVPYGDAFTTVASLVATYLMAKKRVESWYFWICVDLVAIPIYYSKSLFALTGLYTVFLVLAITGLIAWQRTLRRAGATG